MVAPATWERKHLTEPGSTTPCTMFSIHDNRPREGHLDLRGTRLRYRLAGRGPALLLLHGWALDGSMWRALQDRLARHYRVLAVDRRGYGRSSGTPSIEREVGDLRVLCQRLGLRNVALLGMSQATRVALRLAQSRSLRASCLVLDGPPGPTRGEADPAREDPPLTLYRQLVATRGMGAFRRVWRGHALLKLHSAGMKTRHLLDAIGRRYPGRDLKSPGRPARLLDVSRTRAAALVLCGAQDVDLRQAEAADLARRLPRGELRRVPRAGHLPNLDSPLRYERALTAFLRRHARC